MGAGKEPQDVPPSSRQSWQRRQQQQQQQQQRPQQQEQQRQQRQQQGSKKTEGLPPELEIPWLNKDTGDSNRSGISGRGAPPSSRTRDAKASSSREAPSMVSPPRRQYKI